MRLIVGDCIEKMAEMAENSIDACVTDPPYELGFMGKAWDRSGIAFRPETWAAVGRVLKPGGHLLAFGGSRTFHRIACAIEDAGFEIRDTVSWMYGQGFPKSLDVSKAIDEAAGAERDRTPDPEWFGQSVSIFGGESNRTISNPVTAAAAAWSGWGTALKPAWEPVIMARKPLIGTVAENVLRHGTGGVNVEGCRLEAPDGVPRFTNKGGDSVLAYADGLHGSARTGQIDVTTGRWPANVCLDEEAAAMLDEQSGQSASPDSVGRGSTRNGAVGWFRDKEVVQVPCYGDSGGASRFFYVAKASRAEREEGCSRLPLMTAGEATDREDGSDGLNSPRAGAGRTSPGVRNHHCTVKPIELMRWLVRLVTPPGGHVLDPFAGSGTTGIACDLEDFSFTGIELDAEYARIAQARLDYWKAIPKQMTLAMEDR